MKFFYHPSTDAVGMCPKCGKAACRECIDDVGGALLCKDCQIRISEQDRENRDAYESALRIDRDRMCDSAQRRNTLALLIGTVGGLSMGLAALSFEDPSVWVASLDAIYISMCSGPQLGECQSSGVGGKAFFKAWAAS